MPLAQRTLTAIIAILVLLLGGIAYLCRAYGIVATEPGKEGYQSILSMLVGAVMGRGVFYYVTIVAVVTVLALSANTSFADFPRLCRVLAEDHFLPDSFAVRGRRLVFTQGILALSVLAAALLVGFKGITDDLIPLFAIGAFLAFTLSQAGMVQHWRRVGGAEARHSLPVNALGTLATGLTLVVVAVSKFTDGAWLTVIVIPLLMLAFTRVNRHYRRVAEQIVTTEPLALARPPRAHRRGRDAVVEQAHRARPAARGAARARGLRHPDQERDGQDARRSPRTGSGSSRARCAPPSCPCPSWWCWSRGSGSSSSRSSISSSTCATRTPGGTSWW